MSIQAPDSTGPKQAVNLALTPIGEMIFQHSSTVHQENLELRAQRLEDRKKIETLAAAFLKLKSDNKRILGRISHLREPCLCETIRNFFKRNIYPQTWQDEVNERNERLAKLKEEYEVIDDESGNSSEV